MSTSVSDTAKSSRREQRSSAQTFIDNLKGMAHPNSRRIFIQGSRPDIRVPLREIQLADTFVGGTKEAPSSSPTSRCRSMTPRAVTGRRGRHRCAPRPAAPAGELGAGAG